MDRILEQIYEKERELGITNSYRGWTNEMFEWLYKKRYGTKEIYNEIISRNFIKKEMKLANSYLDVMYVMGTIQPEDIGMIISNDVFVYRGKDKEYCNDEYCKEHNIPIVDLGQEGGTIVASPGTIGFGFNNIPTIEWNYILDKIIDYFGGYKEGNDLMIRGYKVGPISETLGRFVLHLSFNIDLDLINNICLKKMEKTPGGIMELSGKTLEEFIEWINEWLINVEKIEK